MDAFAAIIFDFDGVLIESEFDGNRMLAELLTDLGHRTTTEEALLRYVGLSGRQFIAAIEQQIGQKLPPEFHELRREQSIRALREGVREVVGAVEFVRDLPLGFPKAVASSSSKRWLAGHLAHLGLTDAFGSHVYSGREDVEHGKPAPDIYLHAARQLGVEIGRCVILEDSEVGAQAAVASGATVIGLAAGSHCLEDHGDRLQALGVHHVAASFDEVRRLLRLG
jgi:HAD superfamily hydrolase (TIGR01509 family)